ncbi:ankyrin repeat domain containing protein [Theileria equi strain WA]|uniref:Ankyrin repeat domain containing protein n=1 Tax=Theileria equi strain WA TaxID=1537102 RepID=L1LBJ9_THEEQ|nr:ankyrin repeat domain containing protein [Theileria equi strain WA]EKX72649.1 ankyrin repeat domain containing protein [Theileria equi strain WA]|eukprot:XP_004832101.1 ankyrin repeat domain containing protein [Theileria equi strain WA]
MLSVDKTLGSVSLPLLEDVSSCDGEDISRLLVDFSRGDLLDKEKIPTEDLDALHEHYLKNYPENEQIYHIFASCYIERGQWKQARSNLYCRLYLLERTSQEYNDTINRLNYVEEQIFAEILPLPSIYKERLFFRNLESSTDIWTSQMGYTDSLKVNSFEKMEYNGADVIVSKRHLRPGELLLKSRPLSVAPWRIDPTKCNINKPNTDVNTPSYSCFHCLGIISNSLITSNTFIACPNNPHECPYIFCSEDCFLSNSSTHSSECEKISKIKAFSDKFLGNALALLVLRTLIRCKLLQDDCYRTVEFTESKGTVSKQNELLDQILNFEIDYPTIQLTHSYVLESADKFAYFLLKEIGAEFCLYLTVKELKHFIIALWINCTPVTPEIDSYGDNLQNPLGGVVLSFQTSEWKESTVPNCCINFDSNGYLTIRSIYEIEPETTLYLNTTMDKYLPEFIQATKFWSIRFLLSHSKDPRLTDNLCSIRCNTCINGFCQSLGLKSKFDENKNLPDVEWNSLEEGILCKSEVCYLWSCNECETIQTDDLNLLQNRANRLIKMVKQFYSSGQYLIAKKILEKFVDNWSGILHPSHYLMYNANLLLAGFWMNKAGGNPIMALKYLKRAFIMADEILPKACQERAYLYDRLANLMFKIHTLGGTERIYNDSAKGLILEASYNALWNWTIIAGSKSKEAISAMQKSRDFAFKLNVHTPPLYRKLSVDIPKKYFEILKTVTGSNVVSQTLMKNFVSNLCESADQSKNIFTSTAIDIAFLAAQDGSVTDPILDFLTDVESFGILQHGTGLSILGIAASNCNITLVSALLKSIQNRIAQNLEFIYRSSEYSELVEMSEASIMNLWFSIVGGNELGITPLIALVSMPQLYQNDSVKPLKLETESKIAKRIIDGASKCNNIFKEYQGKIMTQISTRFSEFLKVKVDIPGLLLDAKTGEILNCQTILHYASARGKIDLVQFLTNMGTDVNKINLEGATPLHIASLNGHCEIVELLIRFNAKIEAKLFTGETPLHLAVLNLHKPVVQILIEVYSKNSKNDISQGDCYTQISKFRERGPSIWHALVCGIYQNSHASETQDENASLESLIKRLLNAVKIAKLLAKSLNTHNIFGTYIWSSKLPSQLLQDHWKQSLEDYVGFPGYLDSRNCMDKTESHYSSFDQGISCDNDKLQDYVNDRIFAATRAVQLLAQILEKIERNGRE